MHCRNRSIDHQVTKWKEKFLLVQAQARNSREKLIAAKDAAEAVCSTLSGELNTLKESLKKVESHGQEQQATVSNSRRLIRLSGIRDIC